MLCDRHMRVRRVRMRMLCRWRSKWGVPSLSLRPSETTAVEGLRWGGGLPPSAVPLAKALAQFS
jgi:hypothetical protein